MHHKYRWRNEESMNDGTSGGQMFAWLSSMSAVQEFGHNHDNKIVTGCYVVCSLRPFCLSSAVLTLYYWGWQMPVLTWPHYCFPFITRVNREFFKLHYPDANDNVASPGPVPGQVVKQSIHSGKQEKNKQIRDKSGGKQIIFLQAHQPRMVPYLNAGKNQRRSNQ